MGAYTAHWARGTTPTYFHSLSRRHFCIQMYIYLFTVQCVCVYFFPLQTHVLSPPRLFRDRNFHNTCQERERAGRFSTSLLVLPQLNMLLVFRLAKEEGLGDRNRIGWRTMSSACVIWSATGSSRGIQSNG